MAPREEWDFYLTRIDDKPASICLNLGASVDLSLPVRLQVLLKLQWPRPQDGLSSADEAATLEAFEDALTTRLCALDAEYVGRWTCVGKREYVFYAHSDAGFAHATGSVQREFPQYTLKCRAEKDPDWLMFEEQLRPDALEMQWIFDRRVVDELEHNGDLAELPRPVDHYVYFDDAARRDAFIAAASAQGFTALPNQGDEPLGVHLVREDSIVLAHIHEVVLGLIALAELHGGDYDGWGAPVAKRPQGERAAGP